MPAVAHSLVPGLDLAQKCTLLYEHSRSTVTKKLFQKAWLMQACTSVSLCLQAHMLWPWTGPDCSNISVPLPVCAPTLAPMLRAVACVCFACFAHLGRKFAACSGNPCVECWCQTYMHRLHMPHAGYTLKRQCTASRAPASLCVDSVQPPGHLQALLLTNVVEPCMQVHTPEYVSAFSQGFLDAASCRRIGFGACMADPKLIERTKAEVAGARLARAPPPNKLATPSAIKLLGLLPLD